jgi:hypothetical protein
MARHDDDDDGGRSVHPSWLAMQLMKRRRERPTKLLLILLNYVWILLLK